MEKKPNFIIVGAMKASTTSVYSYLKQHPDIFMTRVKEPMFFNNYKKSQDFLIIGSKFKNKIKTISDYYALFDEAKSEKLLGEASPSYIYDKNTPNLIKKYLPNTKIIIILRQPVDRAYSNFLHVLRSGREVFSSFEDSINYESKRIEDNWSPLYHYINKGYYSEQIERYFNEFPIENIKILLFDDIIQNTKECLEDIFRFLEVDDTFEVDFSRKLNASGIPSGVLGFILKKMRYYRLMPKFALSDYFPNSIINLIFKSVYTKSPRLSSKFRRELTNKYYKEEIIKLQKLINRDLSDWLR